jgi:hypothetical protein
MDKLCKDQWACRAEIHPTSEEMKPYFTFHHVLMLRPDSGNKPMIPADGLRYSPAVTMLNHLLWFLESSVDSGRAMPLHTRRVPLHTG